MSLDDKIAMVHGTSTPYVGEASGWNASLGIPAIRLQDGRQGVRTPMPDFGTTTAWPCALSVAATFDSSAAFAFGRAMGEEFFAKGANVALTPMVILGRVPQGGRNFESCGEDPHICSLFAAAEVRGLQSVAGIVANVDDYVLNNQETQRMSINAIASERAMQELYYRAYDAAVQAGVGSVMCSYNQVNGEHACQSNATLNRDLKDGMGFDGWVLSDWFGTHSTVQSAMGGLDQEMPGGAYFGQTLKECVLNGTVAASRVDDMVFRILLQLYDKGVVDTPNNGQLSDNVTSPEHDALARSLAANATVLLHNKGGILPLSAAQPTRVAVIGDAADVAPQCCGTGSGSVVPAAVVTPLAGIRAAVPSGSRVTYTRSPNATAGVTVAQAVQAAKEADVAVICVSTPSGEGHDRANLSFTAADEALVRAVAAAQPLTVVAMQIPGAALTPWDDEVAALLATFFPGQQMGGALADVLFGKVNPSGRLPLTFPADEADTPLKTPQQYPGVDGVVNYTEELLVGYRWFTSAGVTPRYAFGHGLSFTSFTYSSLRVARLNATAWRVTAEVRNSGAVDGTEVVQLYVAFPAAAAEPPLQLRGVSRLDLPSGAAGVASFTLTAARDLSFWLPDGRGWRVAAGAFGVHVGASSADLRLSGTLTAQAGSG